MRPSMGFVQGEKPALSEKGIRPASVIIGTATRTRTPILLAPDHPEPPADGSVNGSEGRVAAMLEVSELASEDRGEIVDDPLQVVAARALSLLTDLVLQNHQTPLAPGAVSRPEAVSQKLEALTPLQAVAHVGLVRVKRQPIGLRPDLNLGKRLTSR